MFYQSEIQYNVKEITTYLNSMKANNMKYFFIGNKCIPLYSPERMTVNHDVTGSSPVGGATKKASQLRLAFLFYSP